jgi:hypothetical protein
MKTISLITLLLFCMTTPLSAQEPVDQPLEEEAAAVDAALEEAIYE